MRIVTKFLIFIFFTTFSFGQKIDKIKTIRKIVQSINVDTVYTIKKLENDYFVENKNEVADGGQELTGYYKDGQIKKIIYSVGLSYGRNVYEYYFFDGQLVFVFHKQDSYIQLKDSSGEITGFDYSKFETVFEGRYYFEQSKVFEIKNKGKELFPENNKTSELKENSNLFVKELNANK